MSSSRVNNQKSMKNFIFETLLTVDELSNRYPDLKFSLLAPGIMKVEVSSDQEDLLSEFQLSTRFVNTPILFGLNANEALISSNILTFHNYPYGELRGKGIVIGFIDTGIQYTNVNFKEADNTTRILRIWDQTIEGNPPNGYNYGTQYTKEEINRALRSDDPYSIVPSLDEIGHGTYLAGVAAGSDKTGETNFTGGAPEAGIMMVKMRQAKQYLRDYYLITTDVPAYDETDFIAGINYLLQESIKLEMPLVICISVGNNFGAHAGSTIIERYLERVSLVRNIGIVIAAGNEASSGHHFLSQILTGEIQDVEINVGEGERGFTLFLYSGISTKLSIAVKSPLGQLIEKIPIIPYQRQSYRFNLEKARLEVIYFYPDPVTGGVNIYIRLSTPTPGIWTIQVYGDNVIDGTYNLWLPRNGFILESTRFLKPDPNITIQNPGTNENTLLVGGYDYVDQSIYPASGRGPNNNNVIKPDIIAPCVNVLGPSITGGDTTYIGTSTAAAITSSATALLLEWGILNQNLIDMNTRIIRAILIRGARRSPGTIYPNNVEGYGRLDLQKSIAMIY